MGIRVNVTMGWGFKKAKYEDPRFSEEFLKFWDASGDILPQFLAAVKDAKKNSKPPEGEYNRDEGDASLLLQKLEGKGWYKEKKPVDHLCVYDFIQQSGFSSEMRNAPIVFSPAEHDDWYRHDNTIDYYQAGPEPKDKVQLIADQCGFPYPPFPYAIYVNRKNGRLVPHATSLCHIRQSYDLNGKGAKIPLNEILNDKTLKELAEVGITTTEQLRDDMVPEPPFSIRLFCKTFKVFKDPMEVYNLVPMIYTYWC